MSPVVETNLKRTKPPGISSAVAPGSPGITRGRPGGPYGRHACSSCRKRKIKCVGEGASCSPCQKSGISCTRMSAKRPFTKQYLELLEKHNEALDQHISVLESKLAQCQKEHGGFQNPQILSRPVMALSPTDFDMDMADEESVSESDTDSDGGPGIKQLIAPKKRLVLLDGDLYLYGSFSPFAHEQVPKRASRFPQAYENYKSRYVLLVDGADETHTNPNFDWSRHLPVEVPLHRREHDKLLDLLFKFVTSWGLRIVPTLFLRDMFRALSVPPSQPPPRTPHYSPMLHNALVALAMAFSDDFRICDLNSRLYFARKAKSYMEAECQSPNISVVHALSILASFHSSLGDQTLGYLYFGMSGRISQVLGLSIDSSPLVKSNLITHDDMLDRNWAHWTTFSQDVCWSSFVGRDFCVLSPSDQQRIPVPFVDPEFDQIPWHYPASGLGPQPGFLSTTFANSCELLRIARWIMEVVSGFRKRPGVNHATISKIDDQLVNWKGRLPPEADITPATLSTALPHRLMLHLAYWWLYILLHRPFYRRSRNSPPSEFAIDHVQHCNTAAEHILELVETWRKLYTLRYVPILWIQIVYSAGTIYLLSAAQAGSASPAAVQARKHSLAQAETCVQYLYQAGKSWQTARHVKQILEKLLKELTTRFETRPQESAKHSNGRRKSTLNSSPSAERPGEQSTNLNPDTHTTDFPPFPTSPMQIPHAPVQPSSSLGGAFGTGYAVSPFAPALNASSSFEMNGQFGMPGIPHNHALTPQNFLSFGDPALTAFGGIAFPQGIDPPQLLVEHAGSESLDHGMDGLDLWPSEVFY